MRNPISRPQMMNSSTQYDSAPHPCCFIFDVMGWCLILIFMLRTWNFAKKKQHDASGVSKPSDWKWEKDERSGIYYPVEKVPEKRPKKK